MSLFWLVRLYVSLHPFFPDRPLVCHGIVRLELHPAEPATSADICKWHMLVDAGHTDHLHCGDFVRAGDVLSSARHGYRVSTVVPSLYSSYYCLLLKCQLQ